MLRGGAIIIRDLVDKLRRCTSSVTGLRCFSQARRSAAILTGLFVAQLIFCDLSAVSRWMAGMSAEPAKVVLGQSAGHLGRPVEPTQEGEIPDAPQICQARRANNR